MQRSTSTRHHLAKAYAREQCQCEDSDFPHFQSGSVREVSSEVLAKVHQVVLEALNPYHRQCFPLSTLVESLPQNSGMKGGTLLNILFVCSRRLGGEEHVLQVVSVWPGLTVTGVGHGENAKSHPTCRHDHDVVPVPVARFQLEQLRQDYELALCVVTCPPDSTQNPLGILTVENAVSSHFVCGQYLFLFQRASPKPSVIAIANASPRFSLR